MGLEAPDTDLLDRVARRPRGHAVGHGARRARRRHRRAAGEHARPGRRRRRQGQRDPARHRRLLRELPAQQLRAGDRPGQRRGAARARDLHPDRLLELPHPEPADRHRSPHRRRRHGVRPGERRAVQRALRDDHVAGGVAGRSGGGARAAAVAAAGGRRFPGAQHLHRLQAPRRRAGVLRAQLRRLAADHVHDHAAVGRGDDRALRPRRAQRDGGAGDPAPRRRRAVLARHLRGAVARQPALGARLPEHARAAIRPRTPRRICSRPIRRRRTSRRTGTARSR